MKKSTIRGDSKTALTAENEFLMRLKIAYENRETIKYVTQENGKIEKIDVVVAEPPESLEKAIELNPVHNPAMYYFATKPMETISGLPRLQTQTQSAVAAQ